MPPRFGIRKIYEFSSDKKVNPSQSAEEPLPSTNEPNKRLLYFAARGNTDEVRSAIRNHGADVHYENDWPLIIAASWGQTETVRALVKEFGADVDAKKGAALNGAAANGHFETVKALVNDCGADVHATDGSAYDHAEMRRHKEMCNFLEQATASRPKQEPSAKPSRFCRLFR
jgi:hypothetical protein